MMRHDQGSRSAAAFVLFLAAFSAFPLDFELSVGIALDIAPYGIETAAPSVALGIWLDHGLVLDPGISVKASWGTDVAELSAILEANLSVCPGILALTAGAGTVYHAQAGYEPGFQPCAVAGLRLESGDHPFGYLLATIRKKPDDDLDSGLCALAGWRF